MRAGRPGRVGALQVLGAHHAVGSHERLLLGPGSTATSTAEGPESPPLREGGAVGGGVTRGATSS